MIFSSLVLASSLMVPTSEAFLSPTIRSRTRVGIMNQPSLVKKASHFVNLSNSTRNEYLVDTSGETQKKIDETLKDQIEKMQPSEVIGSDEGKLKVEVDVSQNEEEKTTKDKHSKILADTSKAQEEFLELNQEDADRYV